MDVNYIDLNLQYFVNSKDLNDKNYKEKKKYNHGNKAFVNSSNECDHDYRSGFSLAEGSFVWCAKCKQRWSSKCK